MSIFPSSASAGQQFTTASNITYIYNGESWNIISTKGILTSTSSTRPASPNEGQLIYETDTDLVLVWNGSEWAEISGGGATVAYQEEQPDVTDLEPGTLWVDSNSSMTNGLLTQTFLRWVKTLSASATTISGNDDNFNPLLYTPEFEQVYINGTLLVRGIDYIASTGNSIVLSEAAVSGDVIEIHCFEAFSIANVYSKSAASAIFATKSELNSIDLSSAIQTASAAAVTYLVDGAPDALNTLNELSEALNDNVDILDLYLTQSSASTLYSLPSQTGNNGKYLTTNGASASWATLDLSTKSDKLITFDQEVASYSLVLANSDQIVEMNVGSANNLTVPLNSSQPFPIGTQITILQTGTGQTTINPTNGVTINATPGLKLRAQWSSATLIKRGTDTWVAIGDLTT